MRECKEAPLRWIETERYRMHKINSSARQYILKMVNQKLETYRYYDHNQDITLHHHDFFEVFIFLSGNVSFFIEGQTFSLIPGDILIISPTELHRPINHSSKEAYERIILWLDEDIIKSFATQKTNLFHCFDMNSSNYKNLLRIEKPDQMYLISLLQRIISENTNENFGSEELIKAYTIELLVKLNRILSLAPLTTKANSRITNIIADIIEYINTNYGENLSLEFLSERFYINKYYLCHQFNTAIGISIYRYIMQKRLANAKQFMREGLSPSQAYQKCGFNDYSNFYRAFKQEYKISPKDFISDLNFRS